MYKSFKNETRAMFFEYFTGLQSKLCDVKVFVHHKKIKNKNETRQIGSY